MEPSFLSLVLSVSGSVWLVEEVGLAQEEAGLAQEEAGPAQECLYTQMAAW